MKILRIAYRKPNLFADDSTYLGKHGIVPPSHSDEEGKLRSQNGNGLPPVSKLTRNQSADFLPDLAP